MQVTHSIYFGESVNVGTLLAAMEEHAIPDSADIDWDYDKTAMILSWSD